MLGALELGAKMVELVPDAFLLQEQQEQRQQPDQDDPVAWNSAKHEAKVNGRERAWQIGQTAECLPHANACSARRRSGLQPDAPIQRNCTQAPRDRS